MNGTQQQVGSCQDIANVLQRFIDYLVMSFEDYRERYNCSRAAVYNGLEGVDLIALGARVLDQYRSRIEADNR